MHGTKDRAGRVFAMLTAGLFATTAFAQAQTSRAGLIPSGDSPALDLVYTGDVIGYLDPCG